MFGRVLIAAITGLLVWKYREPISEYVRGNAGPARETADRLLQTVQERSEAFLDQTKGQISSRLESTRERVRGGTLVPGDGGPTG